MRKIFVIAGPNGSGKTTTAHNFLPDLLQIYDFINADEIARGLAPLQPESVSLAASKLMILRLRELLAANNNFAFETTAAGTNYVRYLKEAQKKKYHISLFYLWLNNADLAVKRVAHRVEQGGHHIPEETIRRRYTAGIRNIIKYYLPIADSALIVDNSGENGNVIAQKKKDSIVIKDTNIWEEMQRRAYG